VSRKDGRRPDETVPSAVEAYLADLTARLPRGVDRDRVVDEVRDHLLDAVAWEMARGLDEDEAACRALKRFGPAKEIARGFDARPRWRTLGQNLFELTFRRKPVAQQRERRCSFCGKGQGQVKRLIAGPNDVQICSECVALCNQIIEKAEGETAPAPA
jgi:hypothetical protein